MLIISKIKKLFSILKGMTTVNFVYLFLGLGFACMLLGVLVVQAGYLGRVFGGILFPLAFFMWGFMGVPMITRKELPWLITLHAWLAVSEGIFLVAIGWGIAVFLWGVLLGLWH